MSKPTWSNAAWRRPRRHFSFAVATTDRGDTANPVRGGPGSSSVLTTLRVMANRPKREGQSEVDSPWREVAMTTNLVVFALIGLLTGAAARLFYPRRQLLGIVGTVALGVAGGLLGGLLSWMTWPAVEGNIHVGSLLMSVLGAVFCIVFWAGVAYARAVSTPVS